LALTGSLGQFTATLPASAITIRGVEFYLSLSSLQGLSLTFPLVNPAAAPAILPVRSPKIVPPALATASVAKYRMISSPAVLDNPSILSQLADDLGPYNPASWRVFRWVRNSYHELVPFIGMTLDPGTACWVITATGTPFSLKRAVSTPSGQYYYVSVDTGWTQIADPFAFTVAWSQVGGSSYMGKPYFYDGTQYMTVATLSPYEGYFVYNSIGETMTLAFPPVESVGTAVPKVNATAAPGPGEYLLQLSAALTGTDYRDTYNYIGFRNGALPGRDALDAPKPPPIGNGLQVNIIDGGSAYLENYKPAGTDGASWVIAVTTTGAKGKAVLTLGPAGTLPGGYAVHVLDLAGENAVPAMPGSFEVDLDAPNAPRYYKVIIGTESFAAKESQGIPLQPVAYALEQNYPNPFNPSTTIRYALEKKSAVLLEVFNTLGQRVRTLVDATQTTGQYAVTWDGTSDGGAHVASGVYFYRLRTGEFTAVRKLAMIR
ncbi:MAG TPA: T9SS type A sorting domain-containing protein, partial [Bacteroidota bacterium]|nr:T9SS type A sorting domain-containing protein [Bacteroidota bacterium]